MDEALAEANKAVDMAPDDVYTRQQPGLRPRHARRVGPSRGAVPEGRRCLQPNWAWLQLLLAEGLQYTEKYTEALAAAETALNLGQGYEARAYRRMGHIYWDKGRHRPGGKRLQEVPAAGQDGRFRPMGSRRPLVREGRLPERTQPSQGGRDAAPNNAGYQAWLGACYEALNMYAEARAALEQALQARS